MTLPGSGALAMSAIMDEIGRDEFPRQATSLDSAENGTYVGINAGSADKPSATNPAAMSEWYGYNHAFSNFSNFSNFGNFGNFGSFGNFSNFSDGYCFATGSLVSMADGTEKVIENIVVGDVLKTFNIIGMPDSNDPLWYTFTINDISGSVISTTNVLHIKNGTELSHYLINNTIQVTHEHKIFIKRNGTWSWIAVENIIVGDMYLDANIQEQPIISIIQVNEPISVVTLNTEENDTYIACGMYNHNVGPK